jgi:hypothetical protein
MEIRVAPVPTVQLRVTLLPIEMVVAEAVKLVMNSGASV